MEIHITRRFILDSPWITLVALGVLFIVFGVRRFVFLVA
jgi:hypothetical protein